MKKLNSIHDLELDEGLRPYLDSYKVESLFEHYTVYLATQAHLNTMHNSHVVANIKYDPMPKEYRRFYMYSGHNYMEVFATTMLNNDQAFYDEVYRVMNEGHMSDIKKPTDKTHAYNDNQIICLKKTLETIAIFIKEDSPPPKPVHKLMS